MSGTEEKKEEETRGRKAIELDKEQIAKLSSIHCSVDEIALIMNCSRDTIYRNYMDIVEQGRAKGKMGLRRKQWETAAKGNATMLIWLGKQWVNQSDDPQNPEDAKPLPWDDNF